jgi:hypothetical protein
MFAIALGAIRNTFAIANDIAFTVASLTTKLTIHNRLFTGFWVV